MKDPYSQLYSALPLQLWARYRYGASCRKWNAKETLPMKITTFGSLIFPRITPGLAGSPEADPLALRIAGKGFYTLHALPVTQQAVKKLFSCTFRPEYTKNYIKATDNQLSYHNSNKVTSLNHSLNMKCNH